MPGPGGQGEKLPGVLVTLRRAERRVSVEEIRSGSSWPVAAVLSVSSRKAWWTRRWAQICCRTPSGVLLLRITFAPRWWVLISAKTASTSQRSR